jgi:hypothetical protein
MAHAIALSATSIGGLVAAANTSVAREYHAGFGGDARPPGSPGQRGYLAWVRTSSPLSLRRFISPTHKRQSGAKRRGVPVKGGGIELAPNLSADYLPLETTWQPQTSP